jgi:hypothetical protein
VTHGAAPRFTPREVRGWGEALARHPRWRSLRIGTEPAAWGAAGTGLRGLIAHCLSRVAGPHRTLEDHLDDRSPGLGRDLGWALRGSTGRVREAVRAAFALQGPRATERLATDPLGVVDELLAAVAALEARARQEGGERRQVRPKPGQAPCDRAYAALGLAQGASPAEVKAAHRRLVKRHHPDMGGKAEDFHRIDAAYRLLIA